MTDRPEISVVICVYNGEYVIEQQLRALAEQDVPFTWDVVIAENRSTDRTAAILEEIAANFPVPITIVRAHAKQGVAYAKNAAVKASRGRSLAFCDSDDRVGRGWLDAARRGLESFDIVGGPLRELKVPFDEDAPFLAGAHLHQNAFGLSVPGGNFAIRRPCYFQVGGMDEALPPYGMEDVDFSARANLNGLCIGSAPEMVSYFRQTRGQKALLRKIYLSGKAEYALWVRYPVQLKKTAGPRDILGDACEVPREVVKYVTTRDVVHLRKAARSVVSFGAHVVGFFEHRGRALASKPILVAPDDDVFAQNGVDF